MQETGLSPRHGAEQRCLPRNAILQLSAKPRTQHIPAGPVEGSFELLFSAACTFWGAQLGFLGREPLVGCRAATDLPFWGWGRAEIRSQMPGGGGEEPQIPPSLLVWGFAAAPVAPPGG